jgi:hypothetical protein
MQFRERGSPPKAQIGKLLTSSKPLRCHRTALVEDMFSGNILDPFGLTCAMDIRKIVFGQSIPDERITASRICSQTAAPSWYGSGTPCTTKAVSRSPRSKHFPHRSRRRTVCLANKDVCASSGEESPVAYPSLLGGQHIHLQARNRVISQELLKHRNTHSSSTQHLPSRSFSSHEVRTSSS